MFTQGGSERITQIVESREVLSHAGGGFKQLRKEFF